MCPAPSHSVCIWELSFAFSPASLWARKGQSLCWKHRGAYQSLCWPLAQTHRPFIHAGLSWAREEGALAHWWPYLVQEELTFVKYLTAHGLQGHFKKYILSTAFVRLVYIAVFWPFKRIFTNQQTCVVLLPWIQEGSSPLRNTAVHNSSKITVTK